MTKIAKTAIRQFLRGFRLNGIKRTDGDTNYFFHLSIMILIQKNVEGRILLQMGK